MGNILVADDDKGCHDSINEVLEKEGHTVQTVGDMESVLKTLATRYFDLVCDYTQAASALTSYRPPISTRK